MKAPGGAHDPVKKIYIPEIQRSPCKESCIILLVEPADEIAAPGIWIWHGYCKTFYIERG
jgi:hypothetical protein